MELVMFIGSTSSCLGCGSHRVGTRVGSRYIGHRMQYSIRGAKSCATFKIAGPFSPDYPESLETATLPISLSWLLAVSVSAYVS